MDLAEFYDDLPKLMTSMKKSHPTRFQVVEPNASYSVNAALKQGDGSDSDHADHVMRVGRMTGQTLNILNKLYNVPLETPQHVSSVQASSEVVLNKLSSLQEKGVDINSLYSQYDVNRTGKVSYKDFSDTLVAVSSGLDHIETQLLASRLDGRKVGSVKYKDILSSLQEIAATTPPPSPTKRSAPSSVMVKASGSVWSPSKNSSATATMADYSFPCNNASSSSISVSQDISQQTTQQPEGYLNEHMLRLSGQMKSSQRASSQSYAHADSPQTNNEYNGARSSVIVAVQSLSPQGLSATQTTSEVGGKLLPGAGRRFYHKTAEHMFVGDAPYHMDPPPGQRKAAIQKQRSASAPSTRGRRQKDASVHEDSLRAALIDAVHSTEGDDENDPSTHLNSSSSSNRGQSKRSDDAVFAAVESQADAILSMINAQHERAAHRKQLAQQCAQRAARNLENSVVDQLGGKLNRLRHALNQCDPSRSGTVNQGEFHQALRNSGVVLSKEQSAQLYDRLATESASSAVMGYTHNKALCIDSFVNRMQARTCAPLFSSLTADSGRPGPEGDDDESCRGSVASASTRSTSRSLGSYARAHEQKSAESEIAREAAVLEEQRVVKKVLHSTSKVSDPHRMVRAIDRANVGWIDPRQLKEALDRLNTNLTPTEYGVLLNKIDRTADGKISVAHFEQVLHNAVDHHDTSHIQQRQAALRQSKRYNPTFQSSETLYAYQTPEYERFADSASYRRERMQWNKLQAALQANQRQVLAAFVPKDREDTRQALIQDQYKSSSTTKHRKATAVTVESTALQQLSVPEIYKNLARVGMPLGGDDINRLTQHLRQSGVESTPPDTFRSKQKHRGKYEGGRVSLEQFCDLVGIQYSVDDKSIIELYNPREAQQDGGTFAASHGSQTAHPTLSTTMFVADDKAILRADIGERRRKFPLPKHVHSEEPSRFWDLTQTSEVAILYPSPIHSLREPWPSHSHPTLDKTAAARGVVRVNRHHTESDNVRSAMFHGDCADRRVRRRAASAPPRTRGTAPTDPILQRGSQYTPGSISDNTSVGSGLSTGRSATAESIARWTGGSSSLAAFFDAKMGGSSGTATQMTNTKDRLNLGASSRPNTTLRSVPSSPSKTGFVTLKRQFSPPQSPYRAPFATD